MGKENSHIMNITIHKDPATKLSVRDKKPARIQLIARLTPKDTRPPDSTLIHLLPRIPITCIESSAKPAHHLQMRLPLRGINDALRDLHGRGQRLLAEHVLVGVDGGDGLLGVHGGYGGDDDGLEGRVLQHLGVGLVDRDAVRLEVYLGPGDFRIVGCRGCD